MSDQVNPSEENPLVLPEEEKAHAKASSWFSKAIGTPVGFFGSLASILALLLVICAGSAVYISNRLSDELTSKLSASWEATSSKITLDLVQNAEVRYTRSLETAASSFESSMSEAEKNWQSTLGNVIQTNNQLAESVAQLAKSAEVLAAATSKGNQNQPTERKPLAVYLVLPRNPNINPGANEMRLGFLAAFQSASATQGNVVGDPFTLSPEIRVPYVVNGKRQYDVVKVIQVEDHRDPSITIAEMQQLDKKYHCLMVVGHEESTPAIHAAAVHYIPNDVPVIFMGPTNPSITEMASNPHTNAKNLFMRLMPSDTYQVEAICKIIRELSATNILIVQDMGNQKYSKWIASQVNESLKLSRINIEETTVDGNQYNGDLDIKAKRHRTLADYDVILFIGMPQSALPFLNNWGTLQAEYGSTRSDPLFVFTDGCTSAEFASDVSSVMSRYGWEKSIFVSPMPPVLTDHNPQSIDSLKAIQFTPLGAVAGELCLKILERAAANSELNKESVREIMQRHVLSSSPIEITDSSIRVSNGQLPIPDSIRMVHFRSTGKPHIYDGDNSMWKYGYFVLSKNSEVLHTYEAKTAANAAAPSYERARVGG